MAHYVGPTSIELDLWYGDLVEIVERHPGLGLASTVVIAWEGYRAQVPTYWTSTPEEFRKYGC